MFFVPTFSKIAAPKLTIRVSFLAMADISSFFIEERALSWKLFFTSWWTILLLVIEV